MMDYVFLAWKGLKHQPLRSFLTVIAVIVAVASIFVLVSLVQGLQETVRGELTKLGTNRLIVIPGVIIGANYGGDTLSEEDLKLIESTPGIRYALGLQRDLVTMSIGREERPVTVNGVDPEKFERAFETLVGGYVEEGRPLGKQDRGKYVAFLGYSVAHDLFDHEILPGSTVYLNGRPFRVVGVMKRTNTPIDAGLYIPEAAFQDITGKEKEYVRIMAEVSEGIDIEMLKERLERRLKALRGGVENFRVVTSEQAFQTATQIINIVGLFLVAVAAVSLVIGALGIMNTMYMSVTERTREIGVMKAVGATKGQIMGIFLVEAGMIGIIGGVVGEILGFIVVKAIESVVRTFLEAYSAYFSPLVLLGLVIFSGIVGMVAGYLPARSAAELDPVEAMRA